MFVHVHICAESYVSMLNSFEVSAKKTICRKFDFETKMEDFDDLAGPSQHASILMYRSTDADFAIMTAMKLVQNINVSNVRRL